MLKRPAVALLIALLAALVVFALCYFVLVGPKKGQISKKQKDVEAAQQKVTEANSNYQQLLKIKNKSAEYEATLAYLQSIIPQQPELPSLIRNLQAAADPGTGAGLPWLSFEPSDITPGQSSTYSTYTFKMSVGGFYDEVTDLVYRMERFPRAVVVTNITIAASTGFLQRVFSENLGVVQANIQAKTFTFTTPTGAAASAPSSTPKPSSSPTSQGSQPSP
ncbi:MAG TPA: type 4a pilus biogenesis protein PilO [Candidatus Anoxymicrobiaceae bacterium]|jgi:Tfp pilus assembly protein PilO